MGDDDVAERRRSIKDWRGAAQSLVTPDAWDYLETGAGDECALREAESAWRHWRFRPHVLRDVTDVSTACSLLGHELATPVCVAPTAYHLPYHSEGEVATARGAAAAGSLMTVSTRASRTIEQIAAAAGPWWMQVYVMAERDITEAVVARAAASGASALVLTGDTPYVSRRARGATLPLNDAAAMVNVQQHIGERGWASLDQNPGLTVADIGWLADLSGLPVLVKGVLRADDARACLDAGAAGVIVSNHGGRQLDRAVPTALALPEVAAAVGDRATVLVDGGIRSGLDVAVALALGANAVCVGRPAIYALAVDGATGVRTMLEALTDDLAEAMGLLGIRSLSECEPSLITKC